MTYDWNTSAKFVRRIGVASGKPQAIMLMERRCKEKLSQESKEMVRLFLEDNEPFNAFLSDLGMNGITLRNNTGSTICYIAAVEE